MIYPWTGVGFGFILTFNCTDIKTKSKLTYILLITKGTKWHHRNQIRILKNNWFNDIDSQDR